MTAKQMNKIEILNDDDRLFKGWASIEIKDKEGQKIPMVELQKIMPVYMERGGFLTLSHNHQIIGKCINYNFEDKGNNPGLKITGRIFSNYKTDNEVWEGMKAKKYNSLSFGGHNHKKSFDSSDNSELLQDVEAWEIAVCEKGMNQEADITEVNFIAKSDVEKSQFEKIKKIASTFSKEPEKLANWIMKNK